MPLTNRDDVRNSLMDSVFARGDLSKPMPKYQFPDRESFPADVFQVIQDELMLDGNSRQNLATFCQTWLEPQVHRLMDHCDRQEHDRQGRVSADGGDRFCPACACSPICGMRPIARRRSVLFDDRVERGGDAGGLALLRRWREKARARGAEKFP